MGYHVIGVVAGRQLGLPRARGFDQEDAWIVEAARRGGGDRRCSRRLRWGRRRNHSGERGRWCRCHLRGIGLLLGLCAGCGTGRKCGGVCRGLTRLRATTTKQEYQAQGDKGDDSLHEWRFVFCELARSRDDADSVCQHRDCRQVRLAVNSRQARLCRTGDFG